MGLGGRTLLAMLRDRQVRVYLDEDGRLMAGPEGKLTPCVRAELKANRDALIRALREENHGPDVDPETPVAFWVGDQLLAPAGYAALVAAGESADAHNEEAEATRRAKVPEWPFVSPLPAKFADRTSDAEPVKKSKPRAPAKGGGLFGD